MDIDPPRTNIDPLTSLRFFAAFAVLFFHSGSPYISQNVALPVILANFFVNGYLGVCFFFILSGFILSFVYSGPFASWRAALRYAAARFARVYPVYLLSLALMLPVFAKLAHDHGWLQLFLLQIWQPFVPGNTANWNGPAWTLSVELFFYLLFPFLIGRIAIMSVRSVMIAAIAMAVLMLAFRLPSLAPGIALPPLVPLWVPMPILRLPEFVFGVCLGQLLLRRPEIARQAALPYICLALVIFVMASSKSYWIAPVAAILFGALILSVAVNRDTWLVRALGTPWIVFLGAASYSLYVLQTPVHFLLDAALVGQPTLYRRVLYYPILLTFGCLVFRYFEEPVREAIRRRTRFAEPVNTAATASTR